MISLSVHNVPLISVSPQSLNLFMDCMFIYRQPKKKKKCRVVQELLNIVDKNSVILVSYIISSLNWILFLYKMLLATCCYTMFTFFL